MKPLLTLIPLTLLLPACGTIVGGEDADGTVDTEETPGVGWRAELITRHHNVAGTAVVVDENTLEIRDFYYDGGGVETAIFVQPDGPVGEASIRLSEHNLVGTPWSGDTLTLDLPSEAAFDRWNTITLWCIPFGVSFADAKFEAP